MSHKLKIVLNNTEPKIHRTVIVPENLNFYQLHIVIQCVMKWENDHLFKFNLGAPYRSDSIELKDDEDDFDDFWESRFETYDAEKTYLSQIFNGQKKKISYIYDFGDDWFHTITVLKKPTEEVLFPKCIKGESAAPIEDMGGIWGFYEFLDVINKKRKSEEDKEMMEWYGVPKGKTYEEIYGFDIDEVNERLTTVFSRLNGLS